MGAVAGAGVLAGAAYLLHRSRRREPEGKAAAGGEAAATAAGFPGAAGADPGGLEGAVTMAGMSRV